MNLNSLIFSTFGFIRILSRLRIRMVISHIVTKPFETESAPKRRKNENGINVFLIKFILELNNFSYFSMRKTSTISENEKAYELIDFAESSLSKTEKISKEEKDRIYEEHFMPHADALYNFAYKLAFDGDEAKDLLQETFLKAYRFFDYYEQGTNAKAWLFRILKNTFINDFRKKSKQPHKVDYNEVEEYYKQENVTVDLRNKSAREALGDEVSMAINALAVEFRTVIILCDLEGFTYEEMAKILDIPVGTVRSRLHRARNLLKEKLKGYADKKGYSI